MPSALPTVSRRRVLVGAAALALLSGTVATACGSTTPVEDIDALVGQLERARGDSELAGNAAAAAPPKIAATLTVVAQQRAEHAQALTDEITRISGKAPTTSAATSPSSTATTPTSVPPPKPPTAADVIAALEQSADGASLLATQQSGYRAGLLGSIAAACTAATTVALANAGPTS
ncbi:MAG: hypothetical protein QOD90_816 [Mycobacterium sp.]|nr:hypothetical protein [Mycobacterium sp.]